MRLGFLCRTLPPFQQATPQWLRLLEGGQPMLLCSNCDMHVREFFYQPYSRVVLSLLLFSTASTGILVGLGVALQTGRVVQRNDDGSSVDQLDLVGNCLEIFCPRGMLVPLFHNGAGSPCVRVSSYEARNFGSHHKAKLIFLVTLQEFGYDTGRRQLLQN